MSKKNNKATQRKGQELDQAFSITKFRYHIFKPGNEPDTRTDQTFLAAILRPDKTECRKKVFVFNIISLMKKKTYFGPLFETGLSQSEKMLTIPSVHITMTTVTKKFQTIAHANTMLRAEGNMLYYSQV